MRHYHINILHKNSWHRICRVNILHEPVVAACMATHLGIKKNYTKPEPNYKARKNGRDLPANEKNSWAQGGGQPGPLKSLLRPHWPLGRLPGASQVLFCRTSCKDFCKKSVQRGGTPGRIQILPHSGRLLATSCCILSILAFLFWVPRKFPKLIPRRPPKDIKNCPKNCKQLFFCDISAISFFNYS